MFFSLCLFFNLFLTSIVFFVLFFNIFHLRLDKFFLLLNKMHIYLSIYLPIDRSIERSILYKLYLFYISNGSIEIERDTHTNNTKKNQWKWTYFFIIHYNNYKNKMRKMLSYCFIFFLILSLNCCWYFTARKCV